MRATVSEEEPADQGLRRAVSLGVSSVEANDAIQVPVTLLLDDGRACNRAGARGSRYVHGREDENEHGLSSRSTSTRTSTMRIS